MTNETTSLKRKAKTILDRLDKAHPDARLILEFDNPFELTIVTILAAQCKDETINALRPGLFKAFPDPPAMARASEKELHELIKASGTYKVKSNRIKEVSAKLVDEFGGRVPDTLDALVSLPGIGRKTANIILGNAFGKQAVAVDRHVERVATRIGLAAQKQPDKIEAELCDIIPRERWTRATLVLGAHGRTVCVARKPQCAVCTVSKWCDYFQAGASGMFE